MYRARVRRQDPQGAVPIRADLEGAVCAVVGCGNPLRGDDGAGVRVIERLRERGVPDSVRLVDAGTGGMDVLFALAGLPRAIIVDAVRSGGRPGAVYRVPAEELAALPPPTGESLHTFRWDHALALGRMLLKDRFPEKVEAFLIEVESVGFGLELSAPAAAGVDRVVTEIQAALAGLAA